MDGIKELIGALLISIIIFTIGPIYGFGHAVYFSAKTKSLRPLFIYIWYFLVGAWRIIDMSCHFAAMILDYCWAIFGGEGIEDLITDDEKNPIW